MTEPLVVRREIQVAAPPSTVFAFLTDPEKILRWMGTEATVDPHPGGIYLVNVGGKSVARGSFTEVIPVHRLAYSFGWEGRENVPPGSSLIEIDLLTGTAERCCAWLTAVCPTPRNAPATRRVGPTIWEGSGWRPPAAIRDPTGRSQ